MDNPSTSGYVSQKKCAVIYCYVPMCSSNSVKCPDKIFLTVPQEPKLREKWMKVARKRQLPSPKSVLRCCEDHFDLPNDMLNYMEYRIMGKVSTVRTKPGCIPTKFDCQEGRKKWTGGSTKRPFILKKERKKIVEECLEPLQESVPSSFMDTSDTNGLTSDDQEDADPIAMSSTLVYCVCCLETGCPYINISTCSHSDVLLGLLPEMNLDHRVVCHECHAMLKKIKLFKLQVGECFKLLLDHDNVIPETIHQEYKLKTQNITKADIQHLSIEENQQTIPTIDEIIKKENTDDYEQNENVQRSLPPKSLKNIDDALKIINNNQNNSCVYLLATSLQTLSNTIMSENCNILNNLQDLNNINSTRSVENPSYDPVMSTKEENTEKDMLIQFDNIEDKKDFALLPMSEENLEFCGSNTKNMERPIKRTKTSPAVKIKEVILTEEEMSLERSKMAASPSYLRLPYRCESCLLGFNFEENLEDHVKRKHCPCEGRIKCEVCIQTINADNFDEHTSLHYSRFKCLTCGKQFTSRTKANFHYKKIHTKGVLYKCAHCSYRTPLRSKLKIHISKHKCIMRGRSDTSSRKVKTVTS